MRHVTSPTFWELYNALPPSVQALADKNFELLKANPCDPSLQLKQVNQYWSVRVDQQFCALGIDIEGGVLWFWIGTRAEYDKLTA